MLSTHAHQRHMSSRSGIQVGEQIDIVMDRPDTRALLKVSATDPDAILGWVLYVEGAATPIVHFLYVRARDRDGLSLRGRGFAGQMLAAIGVRREGGVVCTSHGPASTSMRGRYKASVHLPLDEFLK